MKKEKKHIVPTDQDYIGNVNLVTGAKFNYDKQLPTQGQIRELCIDEKKSKVEKFLKIMEDGQKIQKWSIFQNLNYYCQSNMENRQSRDNRVPEKILEILVKNYSQLVDYVGIIGDGISSIIGNPRIILSDISVSFIFELGFRTLTLTSSSQLEEWESVFEKIANRLRNQQMQKCLTYIQGAFQMNSPPEKRRSALIMINALYEVVFKQDLVISLHENRNFRTRLTISKIMTKLLAKKGHDEELWKTVWDYFHDKQESVKRKAIEILFNYFHLPNFKKILDSVFTEEGCEHAIIEHLQLFSHSFKSLVENDKKSKLQIVAFCNRVINSRKNENICLLLSKIKPSLLPLLGQIRVFSDLNFGALKLKNPEIMESYFQVYGCISSPQFKDNYKTQLFKALKETKFQSIHKIDSLRTILDLSVEEEVGIYLSICNNLLENSKWHQLSTLLQIFEGAKLFQTVYDKFCNFFLKAIMICPKFVFPTVTKSIIYLLILNRKSLQFFITIREKLMAGKSWIHRSSYIILYASIKACTSFEYHKLVPAFSYKNIANQKNYGVRLTYLAQAPTIYKYTEPENTSEKALIKETINKLRDDKDKYVREAAAQCKKQIQAIDKETNHLQDLYRRNETLHLNENGTHQLQTQPKRANKTEIDIRKSLFKKKTPNQNRRTTNIIRQNSLIYKDVSIDSLATMARKKTPYLDLNKDKKQNLFRCHSVKMKVPVAKKKELN